MDQLKEFELVDDYFSVEKTIEVVVSMEGRPAHFRIEALRRRRGTYSTRTFCQQTIAPLSHKGEKRIVMKVWTEMDLANADGQTAEEAVRLALGLLLKDIR